MSINVKHLDWIYLLFRIVNLKKCKCRWSSMAYESHDNIEHHEVVQEVLQHWDLDELRNVYGGDIFTVPSN